jgi:hypothetical protein
VLLAFLEIHDLCVSKLTVAVTGGFGRRSDRAFVAALVEAGHVDTQTLHDRIDRLPESVDRRVRAAAHRIVEGVT